MNLQRTWISSDVALYYRKSFAHFELKKYWLAGDKAGDGEKLLQNFSQTCE